MATIINNYCGWGGRGGGGGRGGRGKRSSKYTLKLPTNFIFIIIQVRQCYVWVEFPFMHLYKICI